MAIHNNPGLARAAAVAGAPGLIPAGFTYTFTGACPPRSTNIATVNVTYTAPSLTGMFGSNVTLQGTGAMQCGG
jgi:hypothetical protein